MIDWALNLGSRLKTRFSRAQLERRWGWLREHGMHVGHDVNLPASTWIDREYCFLISIGDHCGFGEQCVILAHDDALLPFLSVVRVGRVVIHASSHIGARSVILPGVEIGPCTLVGSNSVVTETLPANSVCGGNPARVICGLDEYLDKHRARIQERATFRYSATMDDSTTERRRAMREAVMERDAYILGGRSAELRGEGATPRTE